MVIEIKQRSMALTLDSCNVSLSCIHCFSERLCFFFLMIRRPPRSTQSRSSAASDVYKRQTLCIAWYEELYGFGYPAETLKAQYVGNVAEQFKALVAAATKLQNTYGNWKMPYGEVNRLQPVSYTHLTLPTIYSV